MSAGRPTDGAHVAPPATATRETARTAAPPDDVRVLVVGPTGTGGIRQYIDELVDRLAMPVATHDSSAPPEGTGPLSFLRAVLQGLVAMARFPLHDRPDVVHVHSSHHYSFYRAAFYVLFSRYVWRTPVVLHVHGSSFDTFVTEASPPLAALQRVVCDASDRVVVLSDYWREPLSRRTDEGRIRVVPNAVDPTSFQVGSASAVPHVVFVSNLIGRKGVPELVDAVDALAETTDHEFRVSIAGDGPLAPRVEALAERHPFVTYHGYVSESEKRSILADGTVFVLPTHAEGLPIAMLEGMAAGNAVVTTAVGSIPEVIDEERGRLVPVGDPESLAAALDDLLADPETTRQMGERNRRAVEADYSWTAVVDRVTDIYRTVVDEAAAARVEDAN